MAVSLREAPARKSFNNAVSSGASGAGAGDVARALSEGVAVFCATAETESIPEIRKLQMADFTLQIWKGSILKQFCSWCRSLLATDEYIWDGRRSACPTIGKLRRTSLGGTSSSRPPPNHVAFCRMDETSSSLPRIS